MCSKVYVDVLAAWTADGWIIPKVVKWEDGRKFPIDRILDVRPAASLKAGGAGMRYTVRIGRTQSFLFLEDDRWFVEAKQQGA
ncbi:hypothetical protein [Agathobaculum sp.]|uniref:hypothetical protein n=1 Tax=Agathobaculum sp. TaxID=2048138 RepID=UPI002A808745|nr:hypothetical protein [Agathobaculum sp.]MDY3617647.1 hypothetical protein [Agathobaculum sp.]